MAKLPSHADLGLPTPPSVLTPLQKRERQHKAELAKIEMVKKTDLRAYQKHPTMRARHLELLNGR
jgi:hypothetical protein